MKYNLLKYINNISKIGGADEDRTHDLVIANDALSQLSYSPTHRTRLPEAVFMSGRGASVKRQTRDFSIKPRPINGLPAVAAGYSLRMESCRNFSTVSFRVGGNGKVRMRTTSKQHME